jgi:alanine dehydrogenase
MADKSEGKHRMSGYGQAFFPKEEMLEVARKTSRLVIGIPKEEDKNENRVALTPHSVEMLVNNGHELYIESGAGDGSNFPDTDFSEVGASICADKSLVYRCDIILKVSPFNKHEIELLKGNQIIISALNIGTQTKAYFEALKLKKITAIAFELLKDENNCFPVMRSMSEIIGSTSILIAAENLSKRSIGKGKILGGITGVNPSEVVILGSGTAAEFAARTALGLGAIVKVFDHSIYRLRILQQNLQHPVFTSILQHNILKNSLINADVVIGAMDLMGSDSGYVISEDMIRQMKKGSVIVDASIDRGGCFETSRITSHDNPIYVKHGVVHYCVPNIASSVARTASYALSNIFGPILRDIGDSGGLKSLVRHDLGIRQGVFLLNGTLTNNYIGTFFNIPSKDIDLLIAAL